MAAEVNAEEARRQFADLINRVQWQGQHVALTRHGRRAAVLVPVGWYEHAVTATPPADTTDDV